jgi:hypothetical protein
MEKSQNGQRTFPGSLSKLEEKAKSLHHGTPPMHTDDDPTPEDDEGKTE